MTHLPVEHASDCAMHSAPALPPGCCNCGASPHFKLFGYDIGVDQYAFRVFTRESLIAELASQVIVSSVRAPASSVRARVPGWRWIDRALKAGLAPQELGAIAKAWAEALEGDGTALRQIGGLTPLVQLDLSPPTQALTDHVTPVPSPEEIAAALSPYVEYRRERERVNTPSTASTRVD